MADPKHVFVIHGRNMKARAEIGNFLHGCGLKPLNFDDVRATLGGTPSVAEIVTEGMRRAQGIIAIFTADEHAAVRKEFRYVHDDDDAIARWQSRPNVIFEAGMAYGKDPRRVVFVLFGNPKLFTDVAGIHVLRPTNDVKGDRRVLRKTLRESMGCDVDPNSDDWMTMGNFEAWKEGLDDVTPRDPFGDD